MHYTEKPESKAKVKSKDFSYNNEKFTFKEQLTEGGSRALSNKHIKGDGRQIAALSTKIDGKHMIPSTKNRNKSSIGTLEALDEIHPIVLTKRVTSTSATLRSPARPKKPLSMMSSPRETFSGAVSAETPLSFAGISPRLSPGLSPRTFRPNMKSSVTAHFAHAPNIPS